MESLKIYVGFCLVLRIIKSLGEIDLPLVVEYLATNRTLPRLIDVVNVKSSTKEKVVRVVVLILRNLLPKGNFAAQMIDLGLPQVVQSLKAQAWSDEDLLEGLNQLEEGLKDNTKRLSSLDK
ncbi:hypothetical protein CUMW_073140 [Citrus unshiu]|nr:hypothetical protein CUMW_073140 [Citrus unshiu]